jgi:hypothetical protein
MLPYWICDRAMEVMGGSSFLRRSPVQRYYRDARGCAYLAFPMADRRELVTERLLGHEIIAQTPSMDWDPYARYAIQFIQALIAKMPEHIATTFKGLAPVRGVCAREGFRPGDPEPVHGVRQRQARGAAGGGIRAGGAGRRPAGRPAPRERAG